MPARRARAASVTYWSRHRRSLPGGPGSPRPASGPRWRAGRSDGVPGSFPLHSNVFADGIYAGRKVAAATSIIVEIVRKLPDQVGFLVLSRRWVVERFFAWLNRNRRRAKDSVATIASATAFLYAACVMLPIRWLARL